MAPPTFLAVFSFRVESVIVVLPSPLNIAPPPFTSIPFDVLLIIVDWDMVNSLLFIMAPPLPCDKFLTNVDSSIVNFPLFIIVPPSEYDEFFANVDLTIFNSQFASPYMVAAPFAMFSLNAQLEIVNMAS